MNEKDLVILEENTRFKAIWDFVRTPFTVLYNYSKLEPYKKYTLIDDLIKDYKAWFKETTKGNPQSQKNKFAKELISLIEKNLYMGVSIGGKKHPCVLERENRTTNIESDNFTKGYNYARQSISTYLGYTTKGFETIKIDEVIPPDTKFISSDEYFEDELKSYTKNVHRYWMRLINRLLTEINEYHGIKPLLGLKTGLTKEQINSLYDNGKPKYINTDINNLFNLLSGNNCYPIIWNYYWGENPNKQALRAFISVIFNSPKEPVKIARKYFIDKKGKPIELYKKKIDDSFLGLIDVFKKMI